MIDINKKIQKAGQVYARWLKQQSDDENLELNVEIFMSHYLYQELLNLRDEPVEQIGAYIKFYLYHSQEELKRIREKRTLH